MLSCISCFENKKIILKLFQKQIYLYFCLYLPKQVYLYLIFSNTNQNLIEKWLDNILGSLGQISQLSRETNKKRKIKRTGNKRKADKWFSIYKKKERDVGQDLKRNKFKKKESFENYYLPKHEWSHISFK